MAWNPSPEVQVARDAAKAIGGIKKKHIGICVVLFVTDEQLGYASFGQTSALCGVARRMGDIAFEAIQEKWKDEQ